MPSIEMEIKGTDEFLNVLKSIPGALDTVVNDVAVEMRNIVEGRSPVGDPARDTASHQHGDLKKSWSGVVKLEAATFSFHSGVPYASVLEEGRYKGVGPRTVQMDTGIFSRQAPRGMLLPLIEDAELINRIVDNVVREIKTAMGAA